MKNAIGSLLLGTVCLGIEGVAQSTGWYTEGNFTPKERMELTVVNTLDVPRSNCPVVVTRDAFPVKRLHEMWVTVVDPSLPSRAMPSEEEIAFHGGHGIREETNGHQIFYQLDDLDKDGIWDELFFQTDLKPKETKRLFIYFGSSGRGWNPHGTLGMIGSYCRHLVPFWESEHIGWKLWFPTSVDMYGKRKPVLMAHEMCTKNLSGYEGVPKVNYDYGSDIMTVSNSFGAGGIGVCEIPERRDSVSVPRFTPVPASEFAERNFNQDQLTDTRYAFDVVVNGPLRSIVRITTMNWVTGRGRYEVVQDYAAYAKQSYSTCKVTFTRFGPYELGVQLACGIKSNTDASLNVVEDGLAIRLGSELAIDPDDDTGQRGHTIDFVGTALAVKKEFAPVYQHTKSFGGNHLFRIINPRNASFEYLISGAWSEGAVLNTPENFTTYMRAVVREYNEPVVIVYGSLERKR